MAVAQALQVGRREVHAVFEDGQDLAAVWGWFWVGWGVGVKGVDGEMIRGGRGAGHGRKTDRTNPHSPQ